MFKAAVALSIFGILKSFKPDLTFPFGYKIQHKASFQVLLNVKQELVFSRHLTFTL